MEKYDVVAAEKTNDGYKVTVKKSSPDIQSLYDIAIEGAADYLSTLDLSGISSDEELYRIAYRMEMDLLLSGLETADYEEPETYIVRYSKQENGDYDIDEDSILEVLNA